MFFAADQSATTGRGKTGCTVMTASASTSCCLQSSLPSTIRRWTSLTCSTPDSTHHWLLLAFIQPLEEQLHMLTLYLYLWTVLSISVLCNNVCHIKYCRIEPLSHTLIHSFYMYVLSHTVQPMNTWPSSFHCSQHCNMLMSQLATSVCP